MQGVLAAPGGNSLKPRLDDNAAPRRAVDGNTTGSPTGKGPALVGMRKCVQASAVEYTDGPYPPGTREQAMNKGTVTIVSGQAAVQPQPSKHRPGAGTLLKHAGSSPDEAAMREKQIDDAMNR
jgi:hypothetical protein